MFTRCEQDNESTGTMEAEVITVLHSVTKANTSDESDREENKDDQTGIFKVLVRLEEAVDALLNPGSSLLHLLGVRQHRNLMDVLCAPNHFLLKVLWKYI
jgi:hypothetical protein